MWVVLSAFLFFSSLGSAGYWFYFQAPSKRVAEIPRIKQVTQASTEFEKAAAVLEQFRISEVEVLFNGKYLKPKLAYLQAKAYLGRNFKEGDTAAGWIKKYCYRTTDNNIIYFKYDDGSLRPMRDVFLDILAKLPPGEPAK